MGNSFGSLFKITSFGEAHGPAMGVVIDGCPANIELSIEDIQKDLDKRKPGQSAVTTARKEEDKAQILSGVYEGKTLGSPIAIIVPNKDGCSADYDNLKELYRPSHCDFTYEAKYGIRDPRGGGRSSARETVARVAAGAVAKKILSVHEEIRICAYVESIGGIKSQWIDELPKEEEIESSIVRCPDPIIGEQMIAAILEAKKNGDSLGGTIICRIQGCPKGLGAPVFDRLEADLAKAMLSIPATKAFEIGSGFKGTQLKGSEHNDIFIHKNEDIGTITNRSGGVQGGISNGEEIYFRVGFKPTSTILREQQTVNCKGEITHFTAQGRHDPCVLPRAVPIAEAMAALVIVDHYLLNRAINLNSERNICLQKSI